MYPILRRTLSVLLVIALAAGTVSFISFNSSVCSAAENLSGTVTRLGRQALSKLDDADSLLYAYDRLVEGAANAEESISLSSHRRSVSTDDFLLVFGAYKNDYPEHCWVGTRYTYSYEGNKVLSVTLDYLFEADEIPQIKEEMEKTAQTIAKNIPSDADEYEISLYLHNRLASRISYVSSNKYAHTAYGGLVEGQAVCDGYSKAYQYMLNYMGIDSAVVTGTCKSGSSNEAHAWNLSEINGVFCYTDLTWDDQGDSLYYAYFNGDSGMFDDDHFMEETEYTLPVPDSRANTWYQHSGGFVTSSSATVKSAVAMIKKYGTTRFYFTDSNFSYSDWLTSSKITEMGKQLGLSGSLTCSHSRLGQEYQIYVKSSAKFPLYVNGTLEGQYLPGTTVTLTSSAPDGMTTDRWTVTKSSLVLDDPYASEIMIKMPPAEVSLVETFRTDTEYDLPSLLVEVNGEVFTAELYDTETAAEFTELLPLTIDMSELNGNEKYHTFSDPLTDEDPSYSGQIAAGDLMIYSKDTLVMFYDSFSTNYSYTPLGKITDASGLAEALGSDDVTVTIYIDPTSDDLSKEEILAKYRDLSDNWAIDGIVYCVNAGLMNGVSDTSFSPGTSTTRAQVVTILYRLAGSPSYTEIPAFKDLKQDWYRDAVCWAAQNGVVNGTSDTTFSPSLTITREQMATMLTRYASLIAGVDTSSSADITSFRDYSKVSSYATDAFRFMYGEGIITGNKIGNETLLDPKGKATRAQTATMLQRFCTSVLG